MSLLCPLWKVLPESHPRSPLVTRCSESSHFFIFKVSIFEGLSQVDNKTYESDLRNCSHFGIINYFWTKILQLTGVSDRRINTVQWIIHTLNFVTWFLTISVTSRLISNNRPSFSCLADNPCSTISFKFLCYA